MLRPLVVIAVSLCLAVGLGACGSSGERQAAREAAEQIAKAGDQSVDDVLRRYSDEVLLESGDDIARRAAEAARTAERSDQAARAAADSSMFKFTEDTGLAVNETRERYCSFFEVYQSEGSPESFYELALNQLGVPVSARYQVEDAINDLAEAVRAANEGNGLEALIEVTCL